MGMIWKIGVAVFPFKKKKKLRPLSSKMATDVNPRFQTPTWLACQVLPKQIYNRRVRGWIAGGLILFLRGTGIGDPHCWIRYFSFWWAVLPSRLRKAGLPRLISLLQREQFRVLAVMQSQSLLLTHSCLVKGRNKKTLQRTTLNCHQLCKT